MPPLAIAVGALAVGVGVAAVGTLKNAKNTKKEAQALQAQTALQRQQAQLQGMRQRMDAVRTGRQALAQVQQSAENQGVATSSNALGGEGSVVSQMMSNVSFLDSYNNLTDRAEVQADKAAKYKVKADMWGAIGNLGMTVAQAGAAHL
jgi:hypothetical protein